MTAVGASYFSAFAETTGTLLVAFAMPFPTLLTGYMFTLAWSTCGDNFMNDRCAPSFDLELGPRTCLDVACEDGFMDWKVELAQTVKEMKRTL
jgi:hypothetical protein